ncbi:hypothetical protein chiPu_0027521, partial [Chiloscyllium punctatum]|nr:hypothetical protein [Chiloscyllium punctatum]
MDRSRIANASKGGAEARSSGITHIVLNMHPPKSIASARRRQ